MKKNKPRVLLSARILPEVMIALRRLALREKTTLSNVTETVLELGLKRRKP